MIVVMDDLKSLFHLFLGFLTPFIGRLGLLLFLFYMVYQIVEDEDPGRKVGDFFEYLAGVGGCYLMLELIKAF